MKNQRAYFFSLLFIGILHFGISAYYVVYKSIFTNQIFISYPIAVIFIALSLLYFVKGKQFETWLIQKPFQFFWFSLTIAFLIIVPLCIYFLDYGTQFLAETHGVLFDLVVFGVLLSIYESIRSKKVKKKLFANEKKQKIERYIEEIDDFRHWDSDLAKNRIKGNLFRLNKLDHTKLNLAYIKIDKQVLKNIKLNQSSLFKNDFSNSNLENSEFKNITGASSNFIGRATFLLNANFSNADIQYCNFNEAYLNGVNFSNAKLLNIDFSRADLRNANFENTYFFNPKLNGASVDEDFLEKLKTWNISGHPIYDWYEVSKLAIPNYPDHFTYKLKQKDNIDFTEIK